MAAALRRHDCLVCPGVGSAHGVEFGGVWIVIGAGRLTSLTCVIVLDVIAVGETMVLVFESAVRCWLGFTAGAGHRVENERAVWCLLRVIPRLLLSISTAIDGSVACSGRVSALICRHRSRALLYRCGRLSLLHGQLLLHRVNLRGHYPEIASVGSLFPVGRSSIGSRNPPKCSPCRSCSHFGLVSRCLRIGTGTW